MVRYLQEITLRTSCAAIGFLWVPGGAAVLFAPCDTARSPHWVWRVWVLPMLAMQPYLFMADAGMGSCARPPSRFAAPRPCPHIASRRLILRLHPAPQVLPCGAVLCHGNHTHIRTEPTQ